MKKLILAGQKFGRLTVVGENPQRTKSREKRYNCMCSCGKKVTVTGTALRNGTSSCGCIRIELLVKRVTKHRLSKHPLFHLWSGIHARCYSPKATRYSSYGGKGIIVCEDWLNAFLPFYDWACTHGWKPGLTIDRKDNNGNYTPSNCRFITRAENNLNLSTSCWWIVKDLEFESLRQAGKYFKVSSATIIRWCRGYITTSNNFSPRQKGCYAIKKYPFPKPRVQNA